MGLETFPKHVGAVGRYPKSKYFPNGTFFESTIRGSPFWNSIQAVKPAFALGAKFTVRDGRSIRFWLDTWAGDRPLWMEYQGLYSIAVRPDMSIARAMCVPPPVIPFRRELLPIEAASWDSLCTRLGSFNLSACPDVVSWPLASSGRFSVKSLYARLTKGPTFARSRGVWQVRIPLKIKVFLWQMFRNKLPTSVNIAKRQGPSSGLCVMCAAPEDANHVFFRCHLARFAWSAVREVAGVSWNPNSSADLLACLDPFCGATKRVLWRSVGALLWALRNIRNKLTIEGVFPSHPADCIYKCTVFMQ